jgi:hypothetical protein
MFAKVSGGLLGAERRAVVRWSSTLANRFLDFLDHPVGMIRYVPVCEPQHLVPVVFEVSAAGLVIL